MKESFVYYFVYMNKMNELDVQKTYWDNVAEKRTFTHPVRILELQELIPAEGKILDYGCGYGRTCSELMKGGFRNIVGVDISSSMIARGKSLYPDLDLRCFDGESLPFPDDTFDAYTMLAVLTCIPTDAGQRRVTNELHRVLCHDGILYLSYYPIQQDERNQDRYKQFEKEFGIFGVFRLSDGGVVRHHTDSWIYELLSKFDIIKKDNIKVSTMMGNEARVSQILARKRRDSL
jgi:SAM-dependent methyltransferase